MFGGGDIFSDHAIHMAKMENIEWQRAVNEWKNAATRLEQQNAELADANAQNLALRHVLADQLRILDPNNPVLVNEELVTRLRKAATAVYAVNNNFDDVRRMANQAAGRHKVDRESFIRYAYNTAVQGALENRLDDVRETSGPTAHDILISKYREEMPAVLLSNIIGDDENEIFEQQFRTWFNDYVGKEYDKLLASGEFEKDPVKSPTQRAVELGKKMASYSGKTLDAVDLWHKNHKRGHYPPADLCPDGPKPPKPAVP